MVSRARLPALALAALLAFAAPPEHAAPAQEAPTGSAAAQDALARGMELFTARRYAEARQLLASAPAAPDERAALYLGRIAMVEGDFDAAVRWLERAARADDRDAERHYWLGLAHAQKAQRGSRLKAFGPARRSRAELERAVALDPNGVDARLALLQFYLRAPGLVGGSAAKAEAQQRAIAERSAYRGRIAAAALLEDRKDFAGAEREYLAAAREQPDSAAAWYALGLMHQRAGDRARAFDAFERAARANDVETAALYAIGRLAAETGDRLDRGEEALRRYLATPPLEGSPPISSAHYRLGTIYERTSRAALARREYQAALAIERRGEYEDALRRVR